MNSRENSPNRSDHPTLSSALLDGVQRMDSECWSRLVNTFGPIVYGWCRTSGVRESDAADIVQNVFVSVARGIGTFQRQKAEGSFRSWLATITRSRVRDHFRRRANRESAAGGTEAWERFQNQPDEVDDFDSTICVDTASGTINRRVMESVRAEFEPKTWQAFWLIVVEGKSAADVSEQLDVSTWSAYQAKSRILKRLRERLAELP